MNQTDVRRSLAVEIPDQLHEQSADTPPGSLLVDVSCSGGEVFVRVARAGEAAAHVRRIPAADATGSAGARTVALTIAELVRLADTPKPVAVKPGPATAPAPPPPPIPPAAAADAKPTVVSAAGLGVGLFTAGSPPIFAFEFRSLLLYEKSRPQPGGPWAIGPTLGWGLAMTQFWSNTGELDLASIVIGGVIQRRAGRFRPELAIGNRVGFSSFTRTVQPSPVRSVFAGPFAELGLALVVGRTYLRAGVEGFLALLSPGSFCSPDRGCVDFNGALLLASLKLGLMN